MGKKRRRRARRARKRDKRARRLWLADMDRYDEAVAAVQQGTIPVPDTGSFDDCPVVSFVPLLHGEASAEDIDKLIEEIAEEVIQDLGLEKGDERQGRAGDPGVADIFDLSGLPPEAFAPPNTDEEMDSFLIENGVSGVQFKDLGSNKAVMETPIFAQEQISRAVELGLGLP